MSGNLKAEIRSIARNIPRQQLLVFAKPFLQLAGDIAGRVLFQPILQIWLEFRQIEQNVLGAANLEIGAAARRTVRVLQLVESIRRTALFARIAILLRGTAFRTCPLHETVGQKHLAVRTVQLLDRARNERAALLQFAENVGAKSKIFRRIGRIEVVESNLKSGKIVVMELPHFLDQILRRAVFLPRPDHDRRAVRIIRANVNAFVSPHFLEPDPIIRLKIFQKMAQMDIAVGIRQGRRNNDSAFFHVKFSSKKESCSKMKSIGESYQKGRFSSKKPLPFFPVSKKPPRRTRRPAAAPCGTTTRMPRYPSVAPRPRILPVRKKADEG